MKLYFLILVFWFLSACAAKQPVLNVENASLKISPQDIHTMRTLAPESELIWGGLIIEASNLESHTQLEVLAYPLSRSLRPDTRLDPIGRFIVKHSGYLETVDYSPGRLISAAGKLDKLQRQTIGEASHEFPVLVDRQLHLWEPRSETSESRVNFGFGFIFSN